MPSTILITGSSSGIGRAAVGRFRDGGWNVVASLRSPGKAPELRSGEGLEVVTLDVTDPVSVRNAFTAGVSRFGPIDAVLNNAGYGLVGSFESMDQERIERQFRTNVFGLMAVCREAIAHMRPRGRGTLINVSSMGGRLAFPLFSIYHASKWAVDGFSESLQYELQPLGIRVRIIEPGAVRTDFHGRSQDFCHDTGREEYNAMVRRGMRNMQAAARRGCAPEKVAEVIFRAATDPGWKLRYPVGADAHGLLALRRLAPDRAFQMVVRKALL